MITNSLGVHKEYKDFPLQNVICLEHDIQNWVIFSYTIIIYFDHPLNMSFYPNAIISCFPYPFLIFPDKSEFFLFFPSGILHNIYPGNFINSY